MFFCGFSFIHYYIFFFSTWGVMKVEGYAVAVVTQRLHCNQILAAKVTGQTHFILELLLLLAKLSFLLGIQMSAFQAHGAP